MYGVTHSRKYYIETDSYNMKYLGKNFDIYFHGYEEKGGLWLC